MTQPAPYRILCVDDEPAITRALQRCLQRQGWQVITRNSPSAYLQEDDYLPIDLVIADYRMPEMSGVEFLIQMKEVHPDAVHVMLSAHADFNGVLQAVNQAHVFCFMMKPWQDDDLILTATQALKLKALTLENNRLADQMRKQQKILTAQDQELRRLELEHPGITEVERDQDGYIVMLGEDPDF